MYEKYIIVGNLNEAVQELFKNQDNTKILAGGTDLVLEMERGGHQDINTIVDISRVLDGDKIILDDKGVITLGPLTTHSGCLKSEIIQKFAPCLFQACEQVGAPQIRNRGTVVGNIATASPANDTIAALMAMEAMVLTLSTRGRREIPLSSFFLGLRKTALQKDEIISGLRFNAIKENETCYFLKHGLRNAQAISVINVAVFVSLRDGRIDAARIAVGSAAPTVIRCLKAENYLIGKNPGDDIFKIAGEIASQEINPISDIRASDSYRKEMVAVHVKRALLSAFTKEKLANSFPVVLWGKEDHANKVFGEGILCLDKNSKILLTINGKSYQIEHGFEKNLLDLLRENALLTGTKEGCGEGECGACTVYMDGVAVLACLIPAPRAYGADIITIEGIADDGKLNKVQEQFIEEGAVQCGYCTPGFVMSAVKLLEEKPHPDNQEIKTAISGNLCRCTGYYKIISAIEKAAER